MKQISDIFRALKNSSFVRFAIVGCCGVVTNLVIFLISRRYGHLTVNQAAIMAFMFAVTQNYYFNHKWTFRHSIEKMPNILDYAKYVGINIFSLCINLIAINLILYVGFPGFPEVIAQALGVLLGFLLTYILSSVWVFGKNGRVPGRVREPFSTINKNQAGDRIKKAVLDAFRKEYKLGIVICLAIFGVLFIGQAMAQIGNKSILEPVSIQAVNEDGMTPVSFERFMQLARAGNFTFIRPSSDKQKEGVVENVFFKKILVGLSESDLQALDHVSVEIGNKSFVFSAEEFVENWGRVDRTVLEGNFTSRETEKNIFFEAPPSVRFSTSRIPVYRDFFSSIINWAGDDKLIAKPLINSIFLSLLAIFLLILARATVILYEYLQASQKLDEGEIIRIKRDFLIFSVSLYSSIIILCILNLLIYIFYKPDIAGILNEAKQQYVNYIFRSVRPKPVERMQFVISTLISPFVLLVLHGWWSKIVSKSAEVISKWYKITAFFNIFIIAALLYLGLAISGFFYVRDSFFAGDWSKYFYGVMIFPAILFLFFKKNVSKSVHVALEVLAFLSIVVVFSLSVINVVNGFIPQDLDPVIYPMVQVLAGKSLLAPVTSFYGLFPFFLAPVFFLFGFAVLKFSLVMAFLMVISFICIKESARLIIKDRTIYLLGFLTVVFYSVLATRLYPEYYFQYWPVRFLFPSLGLWLTAVYLRQENKFVYFTSFIVFAMGILWNVEVGAALFIAWMGTLFFNDLAKRERAARLILSTLKHTVFGLLSLSLAVGIFTFITSLVGGNLPDFSLLFRYQKLFLSGYLNIGMVPPPHAWTAVVLIYLAGLLVTARAFYLRKISYINKIIFFLSILGLGLFAYYEGQSSEITLFRVAYPALLLAVIFADVLWERVITYGSSVYGELLVLMFILFILFSVPFSLLRNAETYYKFASLGVQNILLRDSAAKQDAAFIRNYAKDEEKVFILAWPEQGIYYAESGTSPVLDTPSVADIVFPKDMETLVNFLNENESTKIFVKQPLDNYDIYDSRIKTILQKRYTATANTENGLSFYELK